jgi:hypothetical protein
LNRSLDRDPPIADSKLRGFAFAKPQLANSHIITTIFYVSISLCTLRRHLTPNKNAKADPCSLAILSTKHEFGALTLSAHAQWSQYGALEDFYQANPDLPNKSPYAGRMANPNYLLIGWDQWSDMDSRLTDNGFVRLGVSNWDAQTALGGGVPQKALAVSFAQALGADIVIYATTSKMDDYGRWWATHYVGFYARKDAEVRRAGPPDQGTSLYTARRNGQSYGKCFDSWTTE